MTRRSITALTLFTSLALVACEDGPTQTYNPVGPGQTPNTGNGTVVNPGSQGYTSSVGGTTKTDICTADLKAKRWKWMVNQPIVPPSKGAGIDIAGGDTWGGLTIDQAEQYNGKDGTDPGTHVSPGTPQGGLCQSTNVGDQFGNGTIVNTWGDGNEVWMDYRVSTRKANWLNFWQGYIGEVKAQLPSAEGGDTWEIPLAPNPIKKNGTNQEIQWLSATHKNFDQPFNQLYRALLHTFAPALPLEDPSTGITCYDTGRCIQGNFGDVAYFYIPAIGFAMWVDNQNAPQPTPSIMTRFDQDLAKTLGYSFANPLMKMDAEGPVASAGELQSGKGECKLQIGLTFGDFLSKCVQTTGDSGKDKTELNKLLGGLSHNTEKFSFDVSGVDINFSDKTLKADDIIHDTDVPTPDDTSTQFNVDQSTLGSIVNDYTGNDVTKAKDWHGAGAVYREYMRLVRQDLLALQGIADGDITKCNFPAGYDSDPSFDPNTFWSTAPAYCTGFEGFITTSQGPAGDINNLGLNALHVAPGGLKTGLKLGHEKVIFCDDAIGGDLTKGYKSCSGGDNFQTAFHRVLKVFGKGNLASLPTEVQDVRFFWKEYVKAAIKYFKVAGDPNHVVLSDVKVDPDGLFFDSVGAGQFEIAEYVERSNADKTHGPIDFQFTADVKNGIMDDYTFTSELYRGESALYAATLTDQSHGIGQDNTGLLTNLFGSPILSAGWTASSAGKSAFYCATNNDPTHCDGQTCPLNAAGSDCLKDEMDRPILYGYEGAFAGNATVFQLQTANPVPVTIVSTYDSIQQAMIDVPLYTNPYDQTSAPLDHMKVLVPWAPKQPGIGFPIALNGGIDRFITTAQLDLSGTTITANIDYDVHIDGTTHKPDKDGKLDFKAVETTDYLGELFMCQDPATGDMLRVRMYTPVANILDWLESHPGTYSACQMVIRYSPFGNYADYITSLANGVRVGITQGGGFGRVNDSTLFVPGQ